MHDFLDACRPLPIVVRGDEADLAAEVPQFKPQAVFLGHPTAWLARRGWTLSDAAAAISGQYPEFSDLDWVQLRRLLRNRKSRRLLAAAASLPQRPRVS